MSFDYKHDLVLGRKEPQLVPQHCIDYDILVDDTPVKASWLRNTTLAECAEWLRARWTASLWMTWRTSWLEPALDCLSQTMKSMTASVEQWLRSSVSYSDG